MFGGFVCGFALPKVVGFAEQFTVSAAKLVRVLLLPIFFAYSGLNTDLRAVFEPKCMLATSILLAVAVAAKGGVSYLVLRIFFRWGRGEAVAMGALMNARTDDPDLHQRRACHGDHHSAGVLHARPRGRHHDGTRAPGLQPPFHPERRGRDVRSSPRSSRSQEPATASPSWCMVGFCPLLPMHVRLPADCSITRTVVQWWSPLPNS